MSGALGSLTVDLNANIAKFTSALEKASYQAEQRSKQINNVLGKIGIGIGAGISAAGIIAVAKSSLDAADNLSKMSQKVGISTENLSALKYAGSLADVTIEQMGTSLAKFNKNIAEAAGGSGEASKAFKALGISQQELANLSPDEILAKVADGMSDLEDGAGKTALAMKIFGKSGADMIPFLNEGAAGLKEMREEAEKFGLILDSETGKRAEAFNDNLTRMQMGFQGIVTQVMAQNLPAMEQFSSAIIDTAKDTELMTRAAETVNSALKILATGAAVTIGVFEAAGSHIASVAAALSFAAQGEMDLAWRAFAEGGKDITEEIETTVNRVANLWDDGAKKIEKAQDKASGKKKGKASVIDEATEKAAAKIQGVIDSLKFEQSQLERTNDEQAVYNALKQAGIGITSAAGQEIESLVRRNLAIKSGAEMMDEAVKVYRDMQAEQGKAVDSLISDTEIKQVEALAEKIEALNARLREGKIDADVYGQALGQALGGNAGDGMRELFEKEKGDRKDKLQSVIESLMSEEESMRASYERRQKIIDDAAAIGQIGEERQIELTAKNDEKYAQETLAREQAVQAQITDMKMTAAVQAAQIFTMIAGESEAAAIAGIAIQKALAIAQIFISTQVASMRALSDLGPIAGPPMAATIETWGAVSMGLVAATGLAEIAAREKGGPVSAGETYLVGERGPELFTPRQSGAIVPNNKLGGGVNQTLVFQIHGDTPEAVEAAVRRAAPEIVRQAHAAVDQDFATGGPIARKAQANSGRGGRR